MSARVRRAAPRRLRNDAGDHAHRGGGGDPVDVDVIGLPLPRQAAQPKPLGIDGQVLREGPPIAVAEQDGQRAESAAGPQEDLLQGALHDFPTEQRSCRAVLLQFGSVLVYELTCRRAGHDPHVISPPQQFLDFGNQEGFAHAIGQGRGDIEDLPLAGFPCFATVAVQKTLPLAPFAGNPWPISLHIPHILHLDRP